MLKLNNKKNWQKLSSAPFGYFLEKYPSYTFTNYIDVGTGEIYAHNFTIDQVRFIIPIPQTRSER